MRATEQIDRLLSDIDSVYRKHATPYFTANITAELHDNVSCNNGAGHARKLLCLISSHYREDLNGLADDLAFELAKSIKDTRFRTEFKTHLAYRMSFIPEQIDLLNGDGDEELPCGNLAHVFGLVLPVQLDSDPSDFNSMAKTLLIDEVQELVKDFDANKTHRLVRLHQTVLCLLVVLKTYNIVNPGVFL